MGTMQIAKTLVSWPMISGVDNSATQIQNDSQELHSQVLSAVCIFFVLYPITYDVYIYISFFFAGAFDDSGGSGDSSWETNLCASQQRGERAAH